jgi:hypothetical protein
MDKKNGKKKEKDLEISSLPAKTVYLVKDLMADKNIEFDAETWRKKYKTLISQITIDEFLQSNPEAVVSARIGFKRYQFIAYKNMATDELLTIEQAQNAIKAGKIKKPNCSTC